MSKNLVIVESPAKGKTIEKFLGSDYKVLASFGHVRALPSKQGSVDIEKGFEPKYHVLPESKKHLDAIKSALKGADRLLLATDPDREGEAISWHLLAALGLDKKNPGIKVQRVEFHEITKDAILHAVKNPRDIALDLVNAQQARSILDYLVGFNLSPFLWKKIRYGLSAGRVQSVALRLVCEREKEILAFNEQEYWTIAARLGVSAGQEFKAGLVDVGGKKLGKFDIPAEGVATALKAALQSGSYQVSKVTKTEKKRNPSPPFTTSTLQQEASRKLGFSAKKTMSTAQKLYEGIDIGAEGTVGLITYMRTDSVNLSTLALKDAHDVIAAAYGKEYALAKPRIFKTKSKNAQEAHEAVRPTYIAKTPAELKKYLSPDLYKLYELIWKRTVACQMAEALLDQTSVDISADLATAPASGPFSGAKRCGLRAAGTVIRFPGFMKLYTEGLDDQDEEKEGLLPAMKEGATLKLHEILPEQHFTQPPPRYTEATLVKTLEEFGIGRPSTFASIMNTLVSENMPASTRSASSRRMSAWWSAICLTAHFQKYVDYNFTAGLEEELDQVSRGEKEWKPLLKEFWEPFIALLKQKEGEVNKSDLTTEATDEACPECGQPLVVKLGKRGKFIACSAFKEGCKYTRNVDGDKDAEASEPEVSEEKCEKCGQAMLIKDGRFGKYLACSGYPACKNIQPLIKPKSTGVVCPECKEGELTEKKSRFGKLFYSCNRYPQCKFALWDLPVERPCPKCAFPLLIKRTLKREGEFLKCPKEGCDFKEGGKEKN